MTAADIVVLILGAVAFGATFAAIRENHKRINRDETIVKLTDRLKQCTTQIELNQDQRAYSEETIASLRDRIKQYTTQRALDQDRIARCDATIESQQIRIFELKENIEQLQKSK